MQWLAVLCISFTAFLMVTCELLPIGVLPAVAADVQITAGQAGLMMTLSGFVASLSAPLVTVLAGRTDRRLVIMSLSALLALSCLVMALGSSFFAVLAARVLIGVAIGGFWTIGIAVGPRLFSEPTGTRGTAVIFSGVSLGTIAGVPAGTFIGDLIGWRWAFGIAAAASLLIIAAQSLFVPRLLVNQAIRWRDLSITGRRPAVRRGLSLALLAFLGQFLAYTYITPFLGQSIVMGPSTISVLLVLMGVTGFAGNLLGGWSAAHDPRRALTAAAFVIAASILPLALSVRTLVAAAALVGVWGLGFGALPIVLQSWMLRAAPRAPEQSSVLFVATAQFAIASGAVLGGVAVDHVGVVIAMTIGGLLVAAASPLAIAFVQREVQ